MTYYLLLESAVCTVSVSLLELVTHCMESRYKVSDIHYLGSEMVDVKFCRPVCDSSGMVSSVLPLLLLLHCLCQD